MVTGKQMAKKLQKGGFDMSKVLRIGKEDIEVLNDRAHRQAAKILGSDAGYKTGYGAWVMQPRFKGKGDWNDPSSEWHY